MCINWAASLFELHLAAFFSAFFLYIVCFLRYDVHDVKDTIFKAYDGLRLVTTFRGRDRFFG